MFSKLHLPFWMVMMMETRNVNFLICLHWLPSKTRSMFWCTLQMQMKQETPPLRMWDIPLKSQWNFIIVSIQFTCLTHSTVQLLPFKPVTLRQDVSDKLDATLFSHLLCYCRVVPFYMATYWTGGSKFSCGNSSLGREARSFTHLTIKPCTSLVHS